MEGGSGSPYSSYTNTPLTGMFSSTTGPSPFNPHPSAPNTPNPGSGTGLGYPSGTLSASGFPPALGSRSASLNSASLAPPPRTPFTPNSGLPYSPLPTGATQGSSVAPDASGFGSAPPTPGVGYATFPASPNPANGGGTNGFHIAPPPVKKIVPKKDD